MGDASAVTTCRSYSAQAFDGCAACRALALEAVAESALYVLARIAPGLVGQTGPVEVSHRLRIRLEDESGRELIADELEAEQTVGLADDDSSDEDAVVTFEGAHAAPGSASARQATEGRAAEVGTPESSMRPDDFQAVIDVLELAPAKGAANGSASGRLAGSLFAYERLVGRFEIEVSPGR